VYTFLTVLHVFVCVFLMLVVLLQAGRGGGIGLAFGGGGGSQSVFGSSGGANFLTKMTAVCAIIFFANSLALAYLSSQSDSRRLEKLAEKKAQAKKAEDSLNAKMLKDIEKQREANEQAATQKSEAEPTPGTEGQAAEDKGTAETAKATDKPAADLKLTPPGAAALKLTPPGSPGGTGKAAGIELKMEKTEKPGKLDKPATEKKAELADKPLVEKKATPKKKSGTEEDSAGEKPVVDKPAKKPAVEKKTATEEGVGDEDKPAAPVKKPAAKKPAAEKAGDEAAPAAE
jgi:preprotein translocase subunit SecG